MSNDLLNFILAITSILTTITLIVTLIGLSLCFKMRMLHSEYSVRAKRMRWRI